MQRLHTIIALILLITVLGSLLPTPAAAQSTPGAAGVGLTEQTFALSITPGSTGLHRMTITNTGASAATFRLELASTRSWIDPKNVETTYPLAPGASVAASVKMKVPAGTIPGTVDTLTVTAISTSDANVRASAQFFSMAGSIDEPGVPSAGFSAPEFVGFEDQGSVSVVITRSNDFTANFSAVRYTTRPDTAYDCNGLRDCAQDFPAQSGRVVFYPGETSKTISLTLVNDTVVEGIEYFDVVLSDPLEITLAQAEARVAINRTPIIPATTEVVDASTSDALTSMSEDGTLRFNQNTAQLQQLQINDVLVGDASLTMPQGFLRRVVGITHNGNEVLVRTEPAVLADAIQEGAVAVNMPLDPNSATLAYLAPGASSDVLVGNGPSFKVALDNIVLYDDDGDRATKDDQIKASGSLTFEPEMEFRLALGWFELEELYFNVGMSQTLDLKVTADIAAVSLKEEVEVARYTFTPITVMVGPVPVVIVPDIVIKIGAEGKLSASITAGVKQVKTFDAGLSYANDEWNIYKNSSETMTYTAPSLALAAEAKAYAKGEVDLLIYGVAGATASIEAYLKLTANPLAKPNESLIKLIGGIDVKLGAKAEVFSEVVASYEAVVMAISVTLYELLAPPAGQVSSVERINTTNTGTQHNGSALGAAMSADGRYVAFTSLASNVVPNDTNNDVDVFLMDRTLHTVRRLTVTPGVGARPSISADGCIVAFEARPNAQEEQSDAFVYDCHTQTLQLLAVRPNGQPDGFGSYKPTVSADGRYVAFVSSSQFLVAGDTHLNNQYNVFVRDLQTNTTTRASVAVGGVMPNGESNHPSISADGRYVAFTSSASNLIANDTNGRIDVFVRDRVANTTTRVSVNANGSQILSGNSLAPTISANGQIVSFSSDASTIVPNDTNGTFDVFVYNTATHTVECVSVTSAGVPGNGQSGYAVPSQLSSDGRFITFSSAAGNLVGIDINNVADVFVYDRQNHRMQLASLGLDDAASNGSSETAAITADGSKVLFLSAASNLVASDTNAAIDIFLATR